MKKNIFIMGSKGIPAKYGGFETFVDELVTRQKNEEIKYYVTCMSDVNKISTYKNATCIHIKTPSLGSAKAVIYDILSLVEIFKFITKYSLKNTSIYILACRIGPFMKFFKKLAIKMNVEILLNPDGHEWKRSKWNKFVRMYWKVSEKLMVKNSDLVICDSKGIKEYIENDYGMYDPKTIFIPYGADITKSKMNKVDIKYVNFMTENKIEQYEYYLIVGRFVPENNYELIIKEFMKTTVNKKLIIISNVEENSFYEALREKTNFEIDERIKFVGTVYNQELLKKIREDSFAYIHGHSVGGTNPSLLEALASTKINILFDVVFNREVGEDSCFYFNESPSNLRDVINDVEKLKIENIYDLEVEAKNRISNYYSWEKVVTDYEKVFLSKITIKK